MHLFLEAVRWLIHGAHWHGYDGIPSRLAQHVELSLVSMVIAAAIAVPAGLAVGHTRKGEFLATSLANGARSIPSFGLLALAFVAVLAISPRRAFGLVPSVVALVALALPPILTNTYVGVQEVDSDALESARGMGLSERQILFTLEVPLSVGLILAGLRTAAVQIVATATLWALFGGGGLGRYIVDGLAQQDYPKMLAGVFLVAILALVTELLLAAFERSVTPRTHSRRTRVGGAPVTDPLGDARPVIVPGSS